MAKYVVKSNEEMASDFITGTCQLLPKSYSLPFDHMHDLTMSTRPPPKQYAIVCGSQAEFYIRPLNTCIDDIDLMYFSSDRLAFSGDFRVLPSDRSGLADTIFCFQIDSYHGFPGFVRLRHLGEMKYNWKQKKYRINQFIDKEIYASLSRTNPGTFYAEQEFLTLSEHTLPKVVCGPAISSHATKSLIASVIDTEIDYVPSTWCPRWPREAKNWPIRPRKYGWPTIDTISEVVQNGCHVVHAQHRSCRDDTYQCRLSFSVAEVILLQSWTRIQQIIYHLLRFFAKRELIHKHCPKEDEILCTYHLKTLMLWTCEEMPPKWWNFSSVIGICCELLIKLSKWLKRRYCPNYFIPEANLFYEPSSSTMLQKTERRLNDFRNSGNLSQWFIENYIQPILRKTFKNFNTKRDFMDYLLPLLDYRKASESKSLDLVFSFRSILCYQICRCAINNKQVSGLRAHLQLAQSGIFFSSAMHRRTTYLPTTEKSLCFKYHATLLYILHTAYGLRYGEISWDGSVFVEFVNGISMKPNIIRSRYHNFPKTYTEQSSWFQFLRATDLMQNLTGSNSRPEFQLLSLMSKQFLRKTLEYDDSKNNGIAPAALAYLAALHFATSEYQAAISYCLAVLVDQTSQKDKETLNAGCLLFIDDIARIIGLCVLQKKISDNNLYYVNRRLYLDLRLSPDVFAHYLIVLSAERISKHIDIYREWSDSSFPMDKNVTALIKQKFIVPMKSCTQFNAVRQIVYRRTDSLTETQATAANPSIVKDTVIGALMKIELEHMTSFYNVIRKDFGIQCNTADCYRALYLYKCRQYDEVLHLCERILHEPELNNDLNKFAFANVMVIPPFDSFFDGGIQSLLGFHTLFNFLSPRNDDMRKVEDSTFERWFAIHVYSHWDVLSVFLLLPYSIKCHYFLGRHFLARYLKVRRCIDCNLPYTQAMTEFTAQKTNLPFEQIIRRFLLCNLRISKKNN